MMPMTWLGGLVQAVVGLEVQRYKRVPVDMGERE